MENRRRKTIARYTGFLDLKVLSRLSGQRTIFPFYHVVSCNPQSHIKHLYSYRSEKEFTKDLDDMLRYFEPVSVADYLKGESNRKRQMVLSFDDGLAECHQYIAPLLKRKGIPAIFFLNNDFIDNRDLFFRYKASMLIDHIQQDRCRIIRASEFLVIPEEQVNNAILMIKYKQRPLLDALSLHLEFDDAGYLRQHPVYMSTEQVNDLVNWGFQLGGHSTDHPEFFEMEPRMMAMQVNKSMKDLEKRFRVKPSGFAFPFTSDGVPRDVIDQILEEEIAEMVFGTAGLKKTDTKNFIQRIPMEGLGLPALGMLKTEYLYYLMKAPLGQNHYFNARQV
jgi:peptidoglycan/xylan/chitin deacetylase (PgdA/CDA1 family)